MSTVSAFLSRPLAHLSLRSARNHRRPSAGSTPRSAPAGRLDLAHQIERHGIDAVDGDELAAVARAGRAAGASDTVVEVLVDRSESRPARERAFGVVQAHVAQSRGVGFHLAA